MAKWSEEEIELVKECLEQGSTHKEIADFIYEDFGIARTAAAVMNKCFKLDIKSKNKVRKTTEQYKLEVPDNIKVLGEYVTAHIKIEHECLDCGSYWEAIPNSILSGHGCPACAGNVRKTTEQYKLVVPGNIKVLGVYINNNTKIEHECLDCSHKWLATPNNILTGRGCPACADKARPGYYGNLTKEQADALGYPLYLYNVKLQYEDEVFFKIGLTKNEDRSRFKQYKPYKVIEELSFEEYDAWTAICKEEEIESNYTPKYTFGGHNECYI